MLELYKNAAVTVPSASTDRVRLFVDTDGLFYSKDDTGAATPIAGGGAVDSVNGQTGVVVLDAADVGAEPADATILKDADIGVTVQGYSAVLAGTTASFTTADETKLDGIEAGAEVNVNADWNATSGDAEILNKPTLYSDASVDTHLNTSTATTDQVLSWNGTDYDWVDQSGGGGGGALTISNKTAAYTVVAGDLGTIINCTSGTFTVALTAAATLGAGFNCWVWNTGTGTITIDPDGTETVDGVNPTTEFKIGQGTGVQLVCTGTAWLTGDTRNSGSASIGVLGTQIGRNSAGNMAVATTGQGAMALGGSYASGTDSFAAAAANNTSSYGATGANSVAIGFQAKATGAGSIAFGDRNTSTGEDAFSAGETNTASGPWSVAMGRSNTASGSRAVALGDGNTASNFYTVALGSSCEATQISAICTGSRGRSDIQGKRVHSSSAFGSEIGSAQTGDLVLGKQTADATPVALSSIPGNAAATINQVILPNNSAYAFSGIIVARQQAAGGSDFAAWEIKGAILRDGTAASTVLGTVNINTLSKTAGATAWTVALTADTTNGGLAITVTGAAATNIRWVATVQTSEVTYA